jgi:FSR family fosmidomycin resistance protein-like MFS transporter
MTLAKLEGHSSSGDKTRNDTALIVLGAVSICHMLNDMMQSLLPAVYPLLKVQLNLDYGQVGLLVMTNQVTASLLQPFLGFYTDRRPQPFFLVLGMFLTLCGLIMLSQADRFELLLPALALVGTGSAIFHPESSRIARMASGGRHGFAQSFFQVGGNVGSSLGPLFAAFVIVPGAQGRIAWFSLAAIIGMVILWQVGLWYRAQLAHQTQLPTPVQPAHNGTLPNGRVLGLIGILLALIASKYFYMASLSNYYIFYLHETFGVAYDTGQIFLFVFFAAVAIGTFAGGPIGDRIGRRYVIWFSILGVLPFSLALPLVAQIPDYGLILTVILTIPIGLILSSAFSAIVVYAQELVPDRVGTMSGLLFGFAFGLGGISAAFLGELADIYSIGFVYQLCAGIPALGMLAIFLPNLKSKSATSA